MKKLFFFVCITLVALLTYAIVANARVIGKYVTRAYSTAVSAVTSLTTNKQLVLGDSKYGSVAKKWYIYSCVTSLNGWGAFKDGPWISNGTWDPSKKTVTVDGNILRSNATFSMTDNGTSRAFKGNGLPVKTPTGEYPVKSTDDAYNYDRNPNSIKTQTISFSLPKNPTLAKAVSCLGMGPIGITLNGVMIYNGLDAGGRDAVAHEIQDDCDGHPEQQGQYHYHNMSRCLKDSTWSKEQSALIGYALDGFGIYGPKWANGKILSNADLDECHGITSEVMWDGKKVSMYHYVATAEYPYTIWCFKGTPVTIKTSSAITNPSGTQVQSNIVSTNTQWWTNNQNTVPAEPLNACKNKKVGDTCGFIGMNNETISSKCNQLWTSLVCGGPR